MKRIILSTVMICILGPICFGQEKDSTTFLPLNSKTGRITYQEVVEVEGNKRDLFNRCINWVNTYYANPVSVTKIRDFETGKIEGRHQFRIHYMEDGYQKDGGMVLYTVRIEMKDGRYRYTITDFDLRRATRFPVENWMNKSDPAYNGQWDDYLRQIDDFARQMAANLTQKMEPVIEEVEEEW